MAENATIRARIEPEIKSQAREKLPTETLQALRQARDAEDLTEYASLEELKAKFG